MTGPSTIAHHHELHGIIDHDREELDTANRKIAELEAEVEQLRAERDKWHSVAAIIDNSARAEVIK